MATRPAATRPSAHTTTTHNLTMNSIFHKILAAPLIALILGAALSSCDDNTGSIGLGVMPSTDQATTSQTIYNVATKSIKVDALVAFSSECFLGRVTDPETNATTTCDFLAQFYNLEDYILPNPSTMHKEDGQIVADSVLINLYIKSYYGDSINSMKIGVYELDKQNVMTDKEIYYTDIDAEKFVSHAPDAVRKELTFAVTDFSIDDTIRFATKFSKNVRIKLPAEYGTKILNTYYQHPEYFKNSYTFIKNVVPGFYFKVLAGNGTMIDIDVSTLTVFFRYTDKGKEHVGLQRIAATGEVIQNNRIENTNIEPLINATDYTFIKSPAGIFTQMTLPIDEIFKGHENDSINSAKIVLNRANNTTTTGYSLNAPSQILMVREADAISFFEKRSVPNNYTSYISKFAANFNSYTFNNIGNLVTHIYKERNKGAGVKPTDTPATRQAKYAAWEAKNPDWNSVVLVPVNTYTNSTGQIVSISNNLALTSVKLVGSTANPVQLSVIYSSFKN